MVHTRTYELLTRLGRLLLAEERSTSADLQPVQLQALHYLSRANRYSDRPQAVAEYLGITKGTASQTLRVLETRGLLRKKIDASDRRSVRLVLTAKGRRICRENPAKEWIAEALDALPGSRRGELEATLTLLLKGLQASRGQQTFGVCHSCAHFRKHDKGAEAEGFFCGLTEESLTPAETNLVCREHEAR